MNKLVIIAVIGLMLSGGATTRICYTERPKDTDVSSSMKQGRIFNKKPIVGKGFDVITKGQVEAEVTTKDGSVVKIKTMKPSLMERIMGFWSIAKPDNVGIGGK